MIQDDEYEAYVATPERIKALGFKPQKEIITCHLLPYADKIDEESKIFLEQVKTNLAKAVMLREMKPACGVWSSRLMKYIRIYGLKFAKEDHIAFIKLAYELVLIPDLEPSKVHKFATMFTMLTKKRYLLSPEELTLPWRPLYEVGIKIFDKSSTSIGMYHYLTYVRRKSSEKQEVSKLEMVRKFLSGYGLDDALELFGLSMRQNENNLPTSLEGSYMSMIKCARTYFEVGATKEILEELLPLICPWSSNSQMMGPLTNFLPIGLHPKYAKQGHELWFGQLMALWDSCYNSQCGISDVMILFAGLAKRNPGAIDWTPHVPKLFMRFLHALNLPVSYKDMQYSRSHSLDMKCVASWIVWTINPDGVVLKHLRSFLAGFESYLHSANSGRWSFKLRDLLRKLAREFLNRVRREREKRFRQTWENKTPELYKLRDEDVTEFVKIVLEPTFQAVYSKSGSLDISIALHNLAILRPAIVIPPLLEKLKTSLTSLTEPHRVTAAMSAVAAVARPMLRGADADYPEGPTHVVPFLMTVLPGLDPNDIKKTLVTLHFILIFSSMVPYIDCSSAHKHWPDLTNEELLVCESTAQMEDFVLIFLDRILLKTQVPPTSMPFANAVPYTVTLDGENMRVALTRLLFEVQAKMLGDKTDDTRGLEMLLQAWERVIVLKGLRTGPGLEARLRSYGALERALDGRGGRLRGGLTASARLRMLIADGARLQDEARMDLVCDAGITPSAMKAVHALYDLAINTYSSVRIFAQIRLYWMLSHYPYSYRALIPRLVELLTAGGDGDEWHARHKGALFMMLGPKAGPLVAKQDWEIVGVLWPAILKAPLSEKPSIHRLEHAFSETLHRHFPAVNTRLTMSQAAVDAAKCLLSKEQLNDTEFMEQLEKSVEREIATSDKTEKVYIQLVNDLVTVAENSKGQWRRLELAMQMLTYCPLVQTPYPPRAVRLMVQSLLHDDIAVRRTAQKLTHFALKQRKHKIKKIEVDPYEIAGVERPEKLVPGYRKDIEWAMWSEDNDILTDEEWDEPWLRDYNYGFYAWPKKIKVAAPVSEQTYSIDRAPEDMEEGERYLYEFFSDEENIDRLVAFFTVEEKKGKDKFNGIRYAMFRLAFAQFGERVSRRLLQCAVHCAGVAHEAPQRFAAELATAALRAPRDWPRARALALQAEALDVIRAGLTAVTPETIEDWGTCVATGVEKMDPRRGAAVLRGLLELCVPPPAHGDSDPDRSTSFVLCARLYALQGALGCMSWRAAPLAVELLKRLESANFIQHPYQNVREIVGSILMTIFDTELVIQGGDNGVAPCLKDFIASVEPRLDALYDLNGDIVVKTAVSMGGQCGLRETIAAPENPVVPITAIPLTTLTKNSPHVARLSTETPRADHAHQTEGSDSAETESEDSVADKQLVEQLNSALRLSGDVAPTQRHHARAVNLLTTVLRGCMGVIVRGIYCNTETQYVLVTTACALAARGPPQPHEELPRAAGGFLASLALANHSCSAFNKALEVLETLAKSRSWWARLACLDYAQPLLFYGLPMLCDAPERAVRAERFALKLMRDSRVEVRQSAAKLLTGLMHCRAIPNEDKTLKSLKRSCRSEDLVERHYGVLGLCAYLASRPYSLSPELGNVLTELSRHTCAPDPIPATIRTALADFRRTHHDDWPKHREQLTEDELDLLADLTSPPSYCA
nr:proteasome activator complex subunit 4B-like [Vanessa tameamea]